MPDAVVIGAGQAGLAASYHLKQRGIDHVLLERGQPGHTWRTQRWDSFRLNTINRMTSLPGMPLRRDSPEGFESAAVLSEYFDRYVEENGLPLQTGANVASVTPGPGADGFSIRLSGDEKSIAARAVIIATGSQNVPQTPAAASSLPPGVDSLNTSTYRNPGAIAGGAVLVVGSGQSGMQIAEDLVDAGRTVFFATSKVGRLKRFHRGRDMTHWLELIGFFRQRPSDLEDPNEQFARQPQISGTMGGHTLSLQRLWRKGVRPLGRLGSVDGSTVRLQDNLREHVEFADNISKRIATRVDRALENAGMELPPAEPDPDDEPDQDLLEHEPPVELDLAANGIRTVIWATGFTGDFSYLQVPGATDEKGLPRCNDCVSDVPGIYFIGMPWVRTRGSGLVYGVGDDADKICSHLGEWLGRND